MTETLLTRGFDINDFIDRLTDHAVLFDADIQAVVDGLAGTQTFLNCGNTTKEGSATIMLMIPLALYHATRGPEYHYMRRDYEIVVSNTF